MKAGERWCGLHSTHIQCLQVWKDRKERWPVQHVIIVEQHVAVLHSDAGHGEPLSVNKPRLPNFILR